MADLEEGGGAGRVPLNPQKMRNNILQFNIVKNVFWSVFTHNIHF